MTMMRFLRRLDLRLFPSVPAGERARILAAMEGSDTETPVVDRLGEERETAGQSGGGDGRAVSFSPSPLSDAPTCETALYWRPDPSHRIEFNDSWLAHLLDRWKESQ